MEAVWDSILNIRLIKLNIKTLKNIIFEVYGWCYAQNAELISYEVKVNNKDVLFEIDSIYRSDVIKEIKINDKEKVLVFISESIV